MNNPKLVTILSAGCVCPTPTCGVLWSAETGRWDCCWRPGLGLRFDGREAITAPRGAGEATVLHEQVRLLQGRSEGTGGGGGGPHRVDELVRRSQGIGRYTHC
jgi:hypothetical protein